MDIRKASWPSLCRRSWLSLWLWNQIVLGGIRSSQLGQVSFHICAVE